RGPRRARAVGIGKAATARAAGPRICPHCRRRLRLLTMPGGVGEILVRCPGSCGRWLVDRGRLRRVS
ncbi:MAG TPA: hypothetical protein VNI83_00650, partial [Vicinamibacterales bacterium]|nr:hypothetical protein [Vicinamibacterales bacterium]